MSQVFVHGWGAVSPAGWGMAPLRLALRRGEPLPSTPLARPGWVAPHHVRSVPAAPTRQPGMAHARLRRSSPIARHAVGAGLEALGLDATEVMAGRVRLGVIVCVMAGCVNYSKRFLSELLKHPATASPMVFPETVFNAPASHLAACLESTGESCTLVGDEGAFAQGLGLAAQWLELDKADACLVVASEEMDWLVADALRLFDRRVVHSDGAGAIYLRKGRPPEVAVELERVTSAHTMTSATTRSEAARRMRAELPAEGDRELLCLGLRCSGRGDSAESEAWRSWAGSRLSPKQILGEAFVASAAWQAVVACDALQQEGFRAANVSIVGTNQQAIGVRFVTHPE